jgi:hypothetical protein
MGPGGNVLLRRHHFPHFIYYPTRRRVLSLYRGLQREANKFIDPLCRVYLRTLIYESFAAYKYLADGHKICALLDIGRPELEVLKKANEGNRRYTDQVFERCLTSYCVKELPLKSLLGINRLDHKEITFQLHNMSTPPHRTFEDHERAVKANQELLFRYLHLFKQNRISTGKNGRKLFFAPPYEGTILGTPLPKNRQKNLLRKYYNFLLNTFSYPIHPETMAYLETQYTNQSHIKCDHLKVSKPKRFYKRRLLQALYSYFTVKQENSTLFLIFSKAVKR